MMVTPEGETDEQVANRFSPPLKLPHGADARTAGGPAKGVEKVMRISPQLRFDTVKPAPAEGGVMVQSTVSLTVPRMMRRFSSAAAAKYSPAEPKRMSPRTSRVERGEAVLMPTLPLPRVLSTMSPLNRALMMERSGSPAEP